MKYIEYIIESSNESHNIHFLNIRQSYMNMGDELKNKFVLFEDTDEKEYNYLFRKNVINDEILEDFNINKFVHFTDDSNPYSLSIIFIYSIELI